jgi:prepilin-type processing-associated H-X9-DG protein
VVIGIIALLVSVLLPALNAARRSAEQTQCLSNVRQIMMAAIMFSQEHKGRVQSCSDEKWMLANDPQRIYFEYGQDGTGNKAKDWASALIPYMGGSHADTFEITKDKIRDIFICPSDRWIVGNEGDPLGQGYLLFNNVSEPFKYYPLSYGINADIAACLDPATGEGRFHQSGVMNVYGASERAKSGLGVPLNARIDRARKPTETPMFADCGVRPNSGAIVDYLDRQDSLYYTTNWSGGGTLKTMLQASWLRGRVPLNRHDPKAVNATGAALGRGGKINVAFCDGHGETVNEAEFDKVRISPGNFTP